MAEASSGEKTEARNGRGWQKRALGVGGRTEYGTGGRGGYCARLVKARSGGVAEAGTERVWQKQATA